MPKVNLNKPPRDELRELILGRKAGLSQKNSDTANYLGMSASGVSRWLNMPSDSLRLGDLKKLCRAYGITADEFRAKIKF